MNPSDSDEPLPHREHIAMRLLDLESLAAGEIHHVWLHVANNGIGEPIRIPILVAKGLEPGPTFGITAALHGNELNGISVIQKLFADLDPAHLKGTIVGVLALNVPGVLMKQRQFNDNVDLNSIAPGKPAGRGSAVYLHRFIDRVVRQFHYLIDLHTASVGRVNSLYVRADMNAPEAARMARLQVPEIIVHNPPNDTTLRGSAAALGIPAITVELRDPSRFQPRTIEDGLAGVLNVLRDLGMLPGLPVFSDQETILCNGSSWMYTDEGGLLQVFPQVTDMVSKGAPVAEVRTIFGEVTKTFFCPQDSIVVGRSVDPINQTGSRILHLGRDPRVISCTVEPR
ncbi:MAG: succinylglutamate desuccinylase/aspartoacylase family protein [Planctomycetota bacterium]